MSDSEERGDSLKPLKIRCISADCATGLHCFRKTKKLVQEGREGRCRYCGADLVDWARVRERNRGDASYTFESLKKEFIRHHFWHVDIDEKAVEKARNMGRAAIRDWAQNRVAKYIAPASHPFDGRQTPWSGNVVFYAQHAVAACCRKCVEEWHGIPLGRAMSEDEKAYLVDLIMRYIAERLPSLTDHMDPRPSLRPARRQGLNQPTRRQLRSKTTTPGEGATS